MANWINKSKSYQEFEKHMDKKQFELDSIVTTIIDQFKIRSAKGKAKYGVDLDRTDLTLIEWIEHAKQEHMDAILYLEKIKQEFIREEQNQKIL